MGILSFFCSTMGVLFAIGDLPPVEWHLLDGLLLLPGLLRVKVVLLKLDVRVVGLPMLRLDIVACPCILRAGRSSSEFLLFSHGVVRGTVTVELVSREVVRNK